MEHLESYGVVIPTWNYARYITQAVESVLGQTHPPEQLIVVDDESADDTRQVLAPYVDAGRIEYVWQKRRWIAATMNEGVRRLRCDVFAFLDADDYWAPQKAELQMRALRDHPEVDLVFGQQQQFVDAAAAEPDRWAIDVDRQVLPGIASNLMMIRRAAFERVGPFREDLVRAHFLDWHARAQAIGLQSSVLPDVLAYRRIHGENASIRYRNHASEYALAAREALVRRRARNQPPTNEG